MTYLEFKELLTKNDISIKKIALEIGYSTKSIENNWAKSGKIPKRAKLALDMYLQIININNEYNQKLENQNYKKSTSQYFMLSHTALIVAENKCKEKKFH